MLLQVIGITLMFFCIRYMNSLFKEISLKRRDKENNAFNEFRFFQGLFLAIIFFIFGFLLLIRNESFTYSINEFITIIADSVY